MHTFQNAGIYRKMHTQCVDVLRYASLYIMDVFIHDKVVIIADCIPMLFSHMNNFGIFTS